MLPARHKWSRSRGRHRHGLFTLVDCERRYKATDFVDTVVYRGSDMTKGRSFFARTGIGLGLQAQRRLAPWAGVAVCAAAVVFWGVHTVFAAQKLRSVTLTAVGFVLFSLFSVLTGLAVAALREMRRTPPPAGLEILPADYKVPYSHLHEDPPEVRLARELEQRRERLAVQQKELEMLEGRLKRKLEQREAGGET